MVHDVLPNYRRRLCFTLWCGARRAAVSNQVDHHTLKEMELNPSLAAGAAIAEAWRRRQGHSVAYDGALPRVMRPLFLPEMRMCLVRMVHADDELRAVEQSHEGGVREDMVRGIRAQHDAIRRINPAWALDLLRQLPAANVTGSIASEQSAATAAAERGVVRPAELRDLAHRLGPWWI